MNNLGDYQGLPYYVPASDVTCADRGNLCNCGRFAGDDVVCRRCIDLLDTALANIPALLEDLEVMQRRQATASRPALSRLAKRDSEAILSGGFGDETLRLPADQIVTMESAISHIAQRMSRVLGRRRPDQACATDAITGLGATLTAIIRALTHEGTLTANHLPNAGILPQAHWLRDNLGLVARDRHGPEMVAEITTAVNDGMRLIDNAPELIDYGACVQLVEGEDGELTECETRVQIPADRQVWDCPRCGTRYDRAELEADKIHAARGMILTVSEMAALTRRSNGALRLWLRRRGIQPVGHRTVRGQRTPVYRAADYLDTLEETA